MLQIYQEVRRNLIFLIRLIRLVRLIRLIFLCLIRLPNGFEGICPWITSSDMLGSLGSGFSFASICGPVRAASAKLRKSRNKTARMAGLKTQQKDSQKFRAKLGLNHRHESLFVS